jgi:hypothetical protein
MLIYFLFYCDDSPTWKKLSIDEGGENEVGDAFGSTFVRDLMQKWTSISDPLLKRQCSSTKQSTHELYFSPNDYDEMRSAWELRQQDREQERISPSQSNEEEACRNFSFDADLAEPPTGIAVKDLKRAKTREIAVSRFLLSRCSMDDDCEALEMDEDDISLHSNSFHSVFNCNRLNTLDRLLMKITPVKTIHFQNPQQEKKRKRTFGGGHNNKTNNKQGDYNIISTIFVSVYSFTTALAQMIPTKKSKMRLF